VFLSEAIDEVKCLLSTDRGALECCFGDNMHQKISCRVEPRFETLSPSLHLRLVNLTVAEHIGKHDVVHYRLVSKQSEGKYTFIDPKTKEPTHISFFSNATANAEPSEPGFVVSSPVCLKAIVDEIKSVEKENVIFNLNIV
jgi:hypothetical protein